METIQIDILDPKARALLEDLAKMDLIRIFPMDIHFKDVLEKIRTASNQAPDMASITKEVDKIRKSRYDRRKKANH